MDKYCIHCGAPMMPTSPVCPQCGKSNEVQAAKTEKKKKEKKGKKRKKGGFLKFLLVLAIIAASVALLWCTVGNYITLRLHTDKVMASLNSGDLDLSRYQSDPYEELPLYVQEMIGQPSTPKTDSPLLNAMAPYLHFERVKIKGFFGKRQVVYRVTSKDLGSWLLSVDQASVTSSDDLYQMMIDQIPLADDLQTEVTVEYTKDGLFGWFGDYETSQFSDAIYGGINAAYNELYVRFIDEWRDMLS